MQLKYTLATLLLLASVTIKAQFTIDGEFRPRTEYLHGYHDLIPKDAEPGFGISTRARLNFGYKAEFYEIYMSLQDVIVWGENRQLKPEDANNSFSIFEAWANIKLGEKTATKLGRQVISYDDQRIMGAVNWAQQGRNHDALLLTYKKESVIADIGLAFNQDYDNISGFQPVGNIYNTTGYFSYKTMEYLYIKKTWKHFSGSFLFLNNGFQDTDLFDQPDGLSNLQTFGTYLKYNKNNLSLASNIYFQTGQRQGKVAVKNAFLFSLDATLKTRTHLTFGAGTEIISGTNNNPGETNAFFPLYGTNHKFNGYMDYFYVGNHANSIGLVDIHINVNYKFSETSSLFIQALNFSGEKALPSGTKSLGTEVDLVYTKNLKGFALKVGYSQMFARKGMYELKGLNENLAANTQNWAWAMLIFKPKFLK